MLMGIKFPMFLRASKTQADRTNSYYAIYMSKHTAKKIAVLKSC